jgi:hypothetical protein
MDVSAAPVAKLNMQNPLCASFVLEYTPRPEKITPAANMSIDDTPRMTHQSSLSYEG